MLSMIKNFVALVVFIGVFISPAVQSDDLEDGISLDEENDDSLRLGKNINFIVQNAKRKAHAGKGTINDGCQGSSNINVGEGSKLKNVTIVNTSKSTNNSVVCVKK